MSSLYDQYKSKHSAYNPSKNLTTIVAELSEKCSVKIANGEALPFDITIGDVDDKVDYKMLNPYLSAYGIVAERALTARLDSARFIVKGFKEIYTPPKDEPVPPSNITWKSLFSWWGS